MLIIIHTAHRVSFIYGGGDILSNLYEQMSFILSGGALRSLTEFLTPKVNVALIVKPKDADLEIVDAVGAAPDGLFLRGWAPKLASAFPARAKDKKF